VGKQRTGDVGPGFPTDDELHALQLFRRLSRADQAIVLGFAERLKRRC